MNEPVALKRRELLVALAAVFRRAGLLDEVRIGAQFFVNATETQATIRSHFRRMRETGLTIARIFTIWDHVEREQGRWNFERYDWIYDAAEENGIWIANTLCSEDPPGWMQMAPFYHQWFDLANPRLRPYASLYLERVVTRYKGHAAHGTWLLQNEPGISGAATGPFLLAGYAKWLETKYRTVDALNKRWYSPLKAFEEVKPPVDARNVGWSDYPSQLDWARFRCDHLAAQLMWLRSEVDRHDKGALTHINPPGLTSNMPASGRDMWKLKPAAHFMGASMHAAWHFGVFPREDFGVAYGFCCDLVRSVSGAAPWWVTELQAGTTVFTGLRPLNPTGAEITRWLWDGIGNGARGIVFWLWHPRTEGNEAGEWALAAPDGEDTERTRATAAVAKILDQNAEVFRSAKPLRAQAAILYNRDAMLLYGIEGRRRPADELIGSLMGCYKALNRAHVAVDFLDVSELETGKAPQYEVLYLPYCYALSSRSCGAIREFVRSGGTVWADGLVAWKDEEGVTKRNPPGPLSDVFGFTVEEIEPAWEPFALREGGGKTGEVWRCVVKGGEIVEHRYGKGRALYYGTALTLRYLHQETPEAFEWIARPALDSMKGAPVRLGAGMEMVGLRVSTAKGGYLAVLTNWGGAVALNLIVPTGSRVKDLTSRTSGVPVRLNEGASTVLLIETS